MDVKKYVIYVPNLLQTVLHENPNSIQIRTMYFRLEYLNTRNKTTIV